MIDRDRLDRMMGMVMAGRFVAESGYTPAETAETCLDFAVAALEAVDAWIEEDEKIREQKRRPLTTRPGIGREYYE